MVDIKRRGVIKNLGIASSVAVLSSTTVAGTDTVHVDPEDPNAYDTIQNGIDAVPDGGVVNVASGIYEERLQIPGSKGITLRGDPGGDEPGVGKNAPVLEGNEEPGIGIRIGPGGDASVTITGFEIRNFGYHITDGWGIGIRGINHSNLTVSDCSVHHIEGRGINASARPGMTNENWTVTNCELDTIAHTAIRYSGAESSQITDNIITASDPVTDRDDGVWWETGTPDNKPVRAIHVGPAAETEGVLSETNDILVEGNQAVGRFVGAAFRANVVNTHAKKLHIDGVTFRDNYIEIPEPADDEKERSFTEHGIVVGENPGPEGRSTLVENVTIEENTVRGATHAFKAMAVTTQNEPEERELRNVVIRENTAIDCRVGAYAVSLPTGYIRNVTVESNDFDNCYLSMGVWNAGNIIEDVRFAKNNIQNGGAFGGAIVSFHANGVSDVVFQDIDFTDCGYGFVVNAYNELGTMSDVRIEDSSFEDCDVGFSTLSEAGTVGSVTIANSKFVDNRIGAQTMEEASGSPIRIANCDFQNHEEFAIANKTELGEFDARCCYWGDPTGPEHEDNRRGRGEPVSDGVVYDPWLPQSHERVSKDACNITAGGRQSRESAPSGDHVDTNGSHSIEYFRGS